jgi:hypothetical protein
VKAEVRAESTIALDNILI